MRSVQRWWSAAFVFFLGGVVSLEASSFVLESDLVARFLAAFFFVGSSPSLDAVTVAASPFGFLGDDFFVALDFSVLLLSFDFLAAPFDGGLLVGLISSVGDSVLSSSLAWLIFGDAADAAVRLDRLDMT